MSERSRVVLIAAIAGLVLVVLALDLTGALSDRKAPLAGGEGGLSVEDEQRIFDGRTQLSNYCFTAIQASRGQTPSQSPEQTEAAARRRVNELLRLGQAHPTAYIAEIGSMRTALTSAARDLKHPACLPNEASRLREAAARLPR
jgi:hypothetical protein